MDLKNHFENCLYLYMYVVFKFYNEKNDKYLLEKFHILNSRVFVKHFLKENVLSI